MFDNVLNKPINLLLFIYSLHVMSVISIRSIGFTSSRQTWIYSLYICYIKLSSAKGT